MEMEQTKYRVEDLKRLRAQYRPGMKVKVKEERMEYTPDGKRMKKVTRDEELTVERIYDYFAQFRNSRGTKESYGYFELESMREGETE